MKTSQQEGSKSCALTGTDFQNKVRDLWKHTKGKPRAPSTYAVPQRMKDHVARFPIEAEIELTEGIAYIVAVKKGVESVSASAIGLAQRPQDGLLVHIASNDGIRPEIQQQVRAIFEAIQAVASRGECALLKTGTDYK